MAAAAERVPWPALDDDRAVVVGGGLQPHTVGDPAARWPLRGAVADAVNRAAPLHPAAADLNRQLPPSGPPDGQSGHGSQTARTDLGDKSRPVVTGRALTGAGRDVRPAGALDGGTGRV